MRVAAHYGGVRGWAPAWKVGYKKRKQGSFKDTRT